MTCNRAMAIAFVAAGAAFGVVCLAIPALQGARGRVSRLAAEHLERARRLLHQYDAQLAYHAALLDQVAADEDARDLSDDAKETLNENFKRLWESFPPTEWGTDRPTPARVPGDASGSTGKGLNERTKLLKENQQLLKEAQTEIDAGLAVSSGDASGRNDAEANRLKGIIEFHQGIAARTRADLKREEMKPFIVELIGLDSDAREAGAMTGLVAASEIDAELEKRTGEISAGEKAARQHSQELDAMSDRIADLQRRIADAKSRRDDAYRMLQQLKDIGITSSSSAAAEEYRRQIEDASKRFRDADREMLSLTTGDYSKAVIDETGDFLRGKYVENGTTRNLSVDLGLDHYVAERDLLARKVEILQRDIVEAQAEIESLTQLRASFAATQTEAAAAIEITRERAEDAYAELNRLATETTALEEEAINQLRKSAASSKQAAQLFGQWVGEGRERTSGLKPEALERAAAKRQQESNWMTGFANAQAADAQLAAAWVLYERFALANLLAQLLRDSAESLALEDADLDEQVANATKSHDTAIEQIQQAMKLLEQAHRDAAKHWTLVAQGANANYLMSLLADKSYLNDAIEGYRKALQGREQESYASPIAERLKQLEAAKQ